MLRILHKVTMGKNKLSGQKNDTLSLTGEREQAKRKEEKEEDNRLPQSSRLKILGAGTAQANW